MAIVQCECIAEFEDIGPIFEMDNNLHSAVKRVWHDAADVFRSVTVDFGAGQVVIECDWSLAFSDDAKSLNLRLSAERLQPYAALNTVEIYLSLVYLAMNLAVPGSTNFEHVLIRTSKERGVPARWSSVLFEGVWFHGDQWPWAQPSEVSLADTWNWLQHLQPMSSQVAKGAVQRALFSLLHSAQETDLSPTILIWLCSALEALYDVPAESIGRTLRNRVFLLLGRPVNHKVAAKQIAQLYDLRSKFAHGSFEVVHPLANDILDSNVNRIEGSLQPVFCFGCALVLSTLQHMIRNGWRALRFNETLLGEQATS